MFNRQCAGIAAAVLALVAAVGLDWSVDAQQLATVRVPTSVLERYVGEYDDDGTTFKIVLSGDTLYQETRELRRALVPLSDTLFYLAGVFTAEFVTHQAGGVTMVVSDGVEVESRIPRKGSRAAPPPPVPTVKVPRSVLERYAGTYEFIPGQMSRSDLRVIVRLKGDTLVRVLAGEQALTPVSETKFRVGNTSLFVEFVVDEAGVTQVMGSGFQQLLARLKRAGAGAQPAQPNAVTLTEAQTAGVKRLKEVLAVLNTGDYATTRAYFEANSVRIFPVPPGSRKFSWEVGAFSQVLARFHRSGGLDLVRVTTEPLRGDVVGIVRNRLSGDEDYLAVRVEPKAPYRISWLPAIEPQVVATFGLKRVASVAVTEEEKLQEFGSYLKRMGDADVFSGAVVIARDGNPVFAQAYGYADREKKIPNTVETPFLLASMNKIFTGLAIGQLVEKGKLSYDDSLSKFLPNFPDSASAKKIKIKHLLSHTSGLGNPLGSKLGEEVGANVLDRQTTVKALVEGLERQPPEFEPGTKWAYSNTGFQLLGRIIEIVTGEDYYEYMQKNVFAPAGAKSASFPLLPRNGVAVVPMAYPYEYGWDEKSVRPFVENYLGKHFRRGSPAGNSIVSALDLIKLSNAMNAGRIVNPETFRIHTSPKFELNTDYGYGFFTRKYGNRPLVGHGGNAMGTCTEFGELRDTPYTIVVLSNLTIDTCMDVTDRLLRVLRPTVPQFALGLSLEKHPEGALVRSVTPGGTSAAMGVKPGDIIVELGGQPVSPQVVQAYVQKTKIGDQVTMRVKREGAIMDLIGKAMALPPQPPGSS